MYCKYVYRAIFHPQRIAVAQLLYFSVWLEADMIKK